MSDRATIAFFITIGLIFTAATIGATISDIKNPCANERIIKAGQAVEEVKRSSQ